jgi:hypothetical protein
MRLTIHYLVPKLWMNGIIPPLPLNTFKTCTGTTLLSHLPQFTEPFLLQVKELNTDFVNFKILGLSIHDNNYISLPLGLLIN